MCSSCCDVTCQQNTHHISIENYTLDVLEAMESAGHECLPLVVTKQKRGKSTIPGWNEHVKPFSEESKFWYQMWLSAGRPIGGDIFTNMKLSKKNFKFAVRRLKRCQDRLQNEKFLID